MAARCLPSFGVLVALLLFVHHVGATAGTRTVLRSRVGVGGLQTYIDTLLRWQSPTLALSLLKSGPPDRGPPIMMLGVKPEQIVALAKKCIDEDQFSTSNAFALMDMPYHEQRVLSLYLLHNKFSRILKTSRSTRSEAPEATEAKRKLAEIIAEFVPRIRTRLNRWTLIDMGVPPILGAYVAADPKSHRHILYTLADSDNVWERRAALLGTSRLVKRGEKADFLALSNKLMTDSEHYVQTAIGLGLRSAGRRDPAFLIDFVTKNVGQLPTPARSLALSEATRAERDAVSSLVATNPPLTPAEIELQAMAAEMARATDINDKFFH